MTGPRYVVIACVTPLGPYYVWDTSRHAVITCDGPRFNPFGYTDSLEAANALAKHRNLAEARRTRRSERAAKGE